MIEITTLHENKHAHHLEIGQGIHEVFICNPNDGFLTKR